MILLEPLEQVLTGPGARELAFDDRTLEEMLSLAGRTRYVQAAEKAEQLWRLQIYDVRTLGCYLLGVFMERGVASLGPILACVHRAVTINLEFLSPQYKRERHLDVSLRFLFDSIVSQVRFHERQKDAVWKKWNDEWLQAGQNQAAERCTLLLASLDESIPRPSCKQPLLHLQSLLPGLGRKSTASADWNLGGGTQIPAPPPPPDPEDSNRSDSSGSGNFGDSSASGNPAGQSASAASEDSSADPSASSAASPGSASSTAEEEGNSSSSASQKGTPDQASAGSAAPEDKDNGKDNDKDIDKDTDKEEAEGDDEQDAKAKAEHNEEDSEKSSPIKPSAASAAGVAGGTAVSAPGLVAGGGEAALAIVPSRALQELLAQLAGFVRLVERKRYRRAGILLRMIRQHLQQFDPTRYFPSLFTDYLVALSRSAGRLKTDLAGQEDLESETLQKLCAADLQRFLAED